MMRWLGLVCVLGCLVCLGCGSGGPELGEVTGIVTMDGQPVANALVTFTPKEGGRSSTGATDASGKYVLAFVDGPGAMVGVHQVTVTTLQQAATPASEMRSDSAEYAKQAAGGQSDYDKATVKETIPAKYNTKTELTFEVKSGGNTFDIAMTSK